MTSPLIAFFSAQPRTDDASDVGGARDASAKQGEQPRFELPNLTHTGAKLTQTAPQDLGQTAHLAANDGSLSSTLSLFSRQYAAARTAADESTPGMHAASKAKASDKQGAKAPHASSAASATASHLLPTPALHLPVVPALPGDAQSHTKAGHGQTRTAQRPESVDPAGARNQAAKREAAARKPEPNPAQTATDAASAAAERPTPVVTGAPAPVADPVTAAALPAVPLAQLLPTQLVNEPGWQAALLPRAAHLTVDTGDAQSLSVHLRVGTDGTTDVRASGAAAPLLAAAESTLRVTLVQAGLSLGQLETSSQDGRHSHHPDDRPERSSSRSATRSGRTTVDSVSSTLQTTGDGRLSVKA